MIASLPISSLRLTSDPIRSEKDPKEAALISQLFQTIVKPQTAPNPQYQSLWHNFQKQVRDVQNPDVPLLKSESALEVLNDKFGNDLVSRVLKRYGMEDKKTFTVAEYKAIVIGAASNVQRTDLEALFHKLKQSGDPSWTKFKSFDDVDDAHIAKLHHEFVNPAKELMEVKLHKETATKVWKIVLAVFAVLACLALITAGALTFVVTFPLSAALALTAIIIGAVGLSAMSTYALSSRKCKPEAPYHALLVQDKDFLKTCRSAKAFNFEPNQHIAASEYLAHDVAYADLMEGQILPLKEKNNQTTYVKVSKIINKEGYVCFILTPLQEKIHQDEFQVRVLFRGTHDIKSLRRLAEPYSAGHLSFKHHQKELLESIAEVVPAHAKHVHTEFYGHSLGGADSLRGVEITGYAIAVITASPQVKAAEAVAFNRPVNRFEGPNWDKIRSVVERIRVVKARVWNSAGVTHSTNNNFKHWVKVINDPSNSTAQPKCIFKISECKVGGDFVQRTGQTTLGHGMGNTTPNVEREVYKFQHGHEGPKGFLRHLGPMATVKAHQIKNLNHDTNKGVNPDYFYANCKTNLAAVEKSSGDHMTWPGELWQKIKWFVMTTLFGSSLNYKGTFYNPFALPVDARE